MFFLPVPLQGHLVPMKTLQFGQSTTVVELVHGVVYLWAEVMLLLEELELGWSVSVEGTSRGHGSGLERLDVLMGITINHPIDKRIFTPYDLDVFGWLHFTSRQANVKGDIVCSFVQDKAFCWCESIIFPSRPLVSILQCIGLIIRASCSWWNFSSSVSLYFFSFLVWQCGVGEW